MISAGLNDDCIDIIPWDNNFNTGVNEIDEQHKHMVLLVNQVATQLTHKSVTNPVCALINELVEYSAYHIDYEESYWSQALPACPHLHQHKESHQLFIERIKKLGESILCAEKELDIEELLQFFASWIMPHILYNDKRMALLVERINSGQPIGDAICYVDEKTHTETETILNGMLVAYRNLVTNTIELFHEIHFGQTIRERLCESEEKLSQVMDQLAYYDSLTQLPNRSLLFDRLHQVIAASGRSQFTNGLLFLDVDDFKNINDNHGYEYGDILLQNMASRIRRCLRDSDTLARFGGDEFVVLLPDLNKEQNNAASQAETVAHKISDALCMPYQLDNTEYSSSVSIGIVLFDDNIRSESELLKQADIAMGRAKMSGKNAVCFFDPEMQKEITARLALENELLKAIDEDEFELYYQPQNNQADEVIGAEALIRWNHPIKGLVGPDEFIPIAEENGFIIAIGAFVLKAACAQLHEWQKLPITRTLSLSVNVSYRQFRDPDFVPMVCQLLNDYQLGKGKLRIELTESMFVDDLEMMIMRMNEMRQKGVEFSLDDFGTGYSSLKNLKRLPLSELKIDKSFIDDLETNQSGRFIVRTIVSMSEFLGLKVIAEGVETKKQKEYLINKHCSAYQGYLYSRPLPIDVFQRYLSKQNARPTLVVPEISKDFSEQCPF